MTTNPLQLRTATEANQTLKLELTRERDRFGTTLRLWVGSQASTVLRSVEGDGQEAWPPSPVIQDPSRQASSDGAFLAGVGMAGNSHWSIVIETRPDVATIDFDYACRVKQEPKWLGSSYSIVNATSLVESSRCLILALGDTVIRCEALADHSECRIAAAPGRFSVVPDFEPERDLPRTIRWKYRFSLV